MITEIRSAAPAAGALTAPPARSGPRLPDRTSTSTRRSLRMKRTHLDGTKEQASMIRRYIIWRSNHAPGERLRRVAGRAAVA